MDSEELGASIVAIQRKARFAGTTSEEWAERITNLIRANEKGARDIEVSNVRPVGTAAGGSNGTMLFDANYHTESGVQTRHLVLRFLPTEGLFHKYDVTAQFELQRALEKSSVPVPHQVWLDGEGAFLRRPGYVMEQVAGVSPPMSWMTSGLIADASPQDRRRIILAYLEALAKIHDVDWRALGLQWLENRAVATKPIERETNWYWDSLKWSGKDEYVELLRPVRDWLIANEPGDIDVVICHGDANYGNYMFEGTTISAVVDWEMAFLGAPECDLSYLLIGDAVLLKGVERPEGSLNYQEMCAAYEELSGRKLRHMDYFELFSAFRVAVINVLAMKHFPPEVLASFMPVLQRGPGICISMARAQGVAV